MAVFLVTSFAKTPDEHEQGEIKCSCLLGVEYVGICLLQLCSRHLGVSVVRSVCEVTFIICPLPH